MKCSECGEEIEGDEYETIDGNPVCYDCIESDLSEPAAIVKIYDDGDVEEYRIGALTSDIEDFKAKYISTDAWRGYYTVEAEDWIKVHDDGILAYSEDEKELDNFAKFIHDRLIKKIRYAEVITRSSNVFFNGYEIWINKDDIEKNKKYIERVIDEAKEKFRDGWRYYSTAMTGKNPSEQSETDMIFSLMSMAYNLGEEE